MATLAVSEKLQALATPDTADGADFQFLVSPRDAQDETGNGGGFVFDARSLPNPGREERFRSQTGKDAAVKEYLEREESVEHFLANAIALVDASARRTRRRGFDGLMVSFGCTGGQHRSVYLAEQLAKHLRGSAGVEVVLRHVELEKMGK